MPDSGAYNTNSRLSHLEQEFAGVKADVSFIRQSVGELTNSIHTVSRELGIARATDWKTIFAGVAIMMSIGTLALAPMNSRINEIVSHHLSFEKEAREHMTAEGHPESVILRLDLIKNRIDTEIKSVEEKIVLQRQVLEEKVRSLDKQLQLSHCSQNS